MRLLFIDLENMSRASRRITLMLAITVWGSHSRAQQNALQNEGAQTLAYAWKVSSIYERYFVIGAAMPTKFNNPNSNLYRTLRPQKWNDLLGIATSGVNKAIIDYARIGVEIGQAAESSHERYYYGLWQIGTKSAENLLRGALSLNKDVTDIDAFFESGYKNQKLYEDFTALNQRANIDARTRNDYLRELHRQVLKWLPARYGNELGFKIVDELERVNKDRIEHGYKLWFDQYKKEQVDREWKERNVGWFGDSPSEKIEFVEEFVVYWQRRQQERALDTNPELQFHPNGLRKAKGLYLNGKKHGLWSYWDENGAKLKEIDYLNDLMHGLTLEYHPNGIKRVMANYENGVQNGIYKELNEQGYFIIEGSYKNGNKHGSWTYNDPNKPFGSIACYDNGVRVSCSQLNR